MMKALLLLLALQSEASQLPHTASGALGHDYLLAAEKAIDDSDQVLIANKEEAVFQTQLYAAESSQAFLGRVASNESERKIANQVFVLNLRRETCHGDITLKPDDFSDCMEKAEATHHLLLTLLNRHRVSGYWTDGPPPLHENHP